MFEDLESEGEEEDTHLCIKCNREIIGLGNYIEHRKSFCSTTKLINKAGTSFASLSSSSSASKTTAGREQSTTAAAAAATVAAVGPTDDEETAIIEGGGGTTAGEGASSAVVPKTIANRTTIKTATPTVAPVKTSSGIINNQDRLKLRRVGAQSKSCAVSSSEGAGRDSGYGIKLAGTSFAGDDDVDTNYDSHFAENANAKSKGSMDKAMVSFDHHHLDYDLICAETPSRSGGGDGPHDGGSDRKKLSTDVVDYNYDYEGADLFFSSLQLQSSSKRKVDRTTKSIGDGGGKLTQSRLYHTFDDDSDELGDEEEDDEDDEDSEEEDDASDWEDYSAPPRTYTGGKWKPESIPPTTGGKWKPGMTSLSTTTQSIKSRTISENSHFETQHFVQLEDEEDRSFLCPPHNHTRGKWVPVRELVRGVEEASATTPTLIKNNASAIRTHQQLSAEIEDKSPDPGVWCSICNRKLTSRVVYERHLKSNLHLSRAALENELGTPSSYSSAFYSQVCTPSNRSKYRTRLSTGSATRTARSGEMGTDVKHQAKMVTQKARDCDDSITRKRGKMELESCGAEGRKEENVKGSSTKPRKPRRKIYGRCDVCRLRLPLAMMGRHLISHMHFRRTKMFGRRAISDAMVLQNIDQIVRLSPFQCQICHFHAITHDLFMRHWWSDSHVSCVEKRQLKRMWCSFCKFEGTPREMGSHLTGEEHLEVVQAINRTVPIVIREKRNLSCTKCLRVFHYNIAIRKHKCLGRVAAAEDEASKDEIIDTASKRYQSIFNCDDCKNQFRSITALRHHQSSSHGLKVFQCGVCSLNFLTTEEAIRHRTTREHKVAANKVLNKDQRRICTICKQECEDIIRLREHIRDKHPEQMYSCLLCGEKFALSQELSRHVRDQACKTEREEGDETITSEDCKKSKVETKKGFSCATCSFRTESEAEITYHELVLHKGSDLRTSMERIPCPWCNKSYQRYTLLAHLRRHKNERIFQCPSCGHGYPRKQTLMAHMKICKADNKKTSSDTQWVTGMIMKCPHEGCVYETDKKANFRKHSEKHLEKKFQCSQCSYKTTCSRYLRKHMNCHKKKK